MYSAEQPVKTWDFEEYDEAELGNFWDAVNALPEGSVIATGFLDDGLVYFEKTNAADGEWTVVQVDNPNVEDAFPIGSTDEGDRAVIDAGGDIEVAYVIKEGPR